jgi:hypothetical protein
MSRWLPLLVSMGSALPLMPWKVLLLTRLHRRVLLRAIRHRRVVLGLPRHVLQFLWIVSGLARDWLPLRRRVVILRRRVLHLCLPLLCFGHDLFDK